MRRDKNLIVVTIGGWWNKVTTFHMPKSTLKIKRFIHTTQSILKLLPLGHRWRGDVEAL